jgi:palmitoyl-protein thioesterase
VGGFFTTLYAAVDFFAKEVRENAKLKQGFNAMGFSQGNNVIRGYMEKYNDPPVLNFISVHGPLAGTGSLPRCPPSTPLVGRLCRLMTELVAEAAYSDLVQRHVFQANYLRDPLNIAQFRRKCTWLADMNGECRSDEEHKQLALVYKTNFIRTKKMLLVRAMRDTMIFPSMSEWFGAYEDGGYDRVLSMNETEWYKRDSFGLRTMFERGAISFSTTQGDHLDFSEAELMSWVDLLFVVKR